MSWPLSTPDGTDRKWENVKKNRIVVKYNSNLNRNFRKLIKENVNYCLFPSTIVLWILIVECIAVNSWCLILLSSAVEHKQKRIYSYTDITERCPETMKKTSADMFGLCSVVEVLVTCFLYVIIYQKTNFSERVSFIPDPPDTSITKITFLRDRTKIWPLEPIECFYSSDTTITLVDCRGPSG